jgi:diguanylate cyclase (GGDEF)-like protein
VFRPVGSQHNDCIGLGYPPHIHLEFVYPSQENHPCVNPEQVIPAIVAGMGISFPKQPNLGASGWIRRFWAKLDFLGTENLLRKTVSNRVFVLRTIIRCSFVCVAVAVSLIGLTVWTLRSDAIRDQSNAVGNIATVLAEQTSRSLLAVDLVLTEIQDHLRLVGIASTDDFRAGLKDRDTFEFLRDRLSQLPEADVITLADNQGKVVNLSREWPAPKVDISDREYFRHFARVPDDKMFIAAPVFSRVSGHPVIFFSKRISGPDGSFLGLVLVGLEPTYFRNIYESITSLAEQTFELVRSDGSIMVRYPRREIVGGRMSSDSPWDNLASLGGGEYRGRDTTGAFQIGASRPAGKYPIFVSVAVPESAALANWESRTTFIAAGTLLIVVCPFFLLLMLRKLLESVITSERSLEHNARELAQLNTRLDLAFNNMSQGLCFFNGQRHLIVCNRRFVEMYDLSTEQVRPGMSLEAIVDLRFQAGTSPKMSRGDYLRWRDSISVSDKPSDTIVELNNGNFFRISHIPMPDGGWVATHEDVTASKRDEARISYMAHHDALTGLASRSYFTEMIEAAKTRLDHRGHPFGLLMLDLDRFKAINDSMGHSAGDTLLKEVARRLKNVIAEDDVVARLGGDEFAIITFGTSIDSDEPHHDGAVALARRVLDVINEPFVIETKTVFVGASIGLALAPDDGVETEALLKKADLALYKSKAKGRNVYSLFDPQMMVETDALHKLEADMRAGLSRSEFEVHYQPIIEARTKVIAGAEALVRWRHPQHGLISPAEFIPIAESTGLIIPLGEFVLHRACSDAMSWPAEIKVAVNLSAIQFHKTNLFDVIMCALIESGLPPERLEVEVTESVLLENESDYAVLLHQLKNIGVSVALDDFGTGYSSLSYLKQFPFDKIKIDRSFTADVAEHEGSMAIVSAIIGLSRGLDMITTAEGIETERQFEIIRAAGVTLAQGNLFGRPCSIAEFNAGLKRPGRQKVAS